MSSVWIVGQVSEDSDYEEKWAPVVAYSDAEDARHAADLCNAAFEDGDGSFTIIQVNLDPAHPIDVDGSLPFRVLLSSGGWDADRPYLGDLANCRAGEVEARKVTALGCHLLQGPDGAPFDYVNVYIMAKDAQDAIDVAERRYAEWLGPDSPYHTEALRSDLV